ncbi:MAG: electron transport complex subunit E [Proteobacteria bacterium]|nr:electron transport complex subunit E [Desulfobacteraceae bacterium]MBU2522003.1 electron transport complex subunit E [Pseudomonadota bacterium]MBU3980520.1 electron transport complex subunit E [Pseudomonadota bacterium]MBU4013594.1 electron transport complex subunit E [Pseudomonadota bacterium]MBU4067368.1 electron transport complex subunit E [Pseudomonadota bacterium]
MASIVKEFTKGLWEEVPPFRFVLGLCSVLAVTTSMSSAIGLGGGVIFVTVMSNVLVSALRKVIPDKVRIAVFIVIIATAVIIVELTMQAYFYGLYEVLGIWIPLIVVNCLVLGRAEAFARKQSVILSLADGLGMGIGFTLSLAVVASIREIIGAGTWFGIQVMPAIYPGFTYLLKPPGAFVCLGIMLGLMNVVSARLDAKKKAAA